MLYNPIKYKHTNFRGGGLMPPKQALGTMEGLQADQDFIPARRIENRDRLILSSNQGNYPHCAGYATAGVCEFHHWRTKYYPKQFDGDAIYKKAKELDGRPDVNGTWPEYAISAAIQLDFIRGQGKAFGNSKKDIQFALHEYDVAIGGFMIDDNWNYVDRKTGRIMDKPDMRKLGGHAVCLCGYDEEGLYIQNSWGENWGLYGFALIPWSMVERQYMMGMVIVPTPMAA